MPSEQPLTAPRQLAKQTAKSKKLSFYNEFTYNEPFKIAFYPSKSDHRTGSLFNAAVR